MIELLEVGDLSFEVRRSKRRKNLSITVDRDGKLVILAPKLCPQGKLFSAIENKKLWIYSKLIDKERQLAHLPPIKEYVSGEGFYYLGKSYRLHIIEPDPDRTRREVFQFHQGQFQLCRNDKLNGRKHFVAWYTKQCIKWLITKLPTYGKRLNVDIPKLNVTDLGYRWGSCSLKQLNFHWRCIMLPVHILEYIMVHELTHILYSEHSQDFWATIERILPDWQERKIWLAENGVKYNL